MKNNLTKKIVISAVIASLYAAITFVLSPISYGLIQFRVSEIMVLLAFFNPMYIIGLTLGCFLANILGGLGVVDVVFGTFATFISVVFISYTGKRVKDVKIGLLIGSIWPVVFNGLIIGWMLTAIYKVPVPMWLAMLQVGFGEFMAVTIVGVPVIIYAYNKYSQKLIF